MELKLLIQGVDDPPRLTDISQPLIDRTLNPSITLCLIEKGMASGEPSVIIISSNESGSVALQTSLDKYLAGAVGMITAAKSRWGWQLPEGYASLMPIDKENRKILLEGLIKELQEWDEVE